MNGKGKEIVSVQSFIRVLKQTDAAAERRRSTSKFRSKGLEAK